MVFCSNFGRILGNQTSIFSIDIVEQEFVNNEAKNFYAYLLLFVYKEQYSYFIALS